MSTTKVATGLGKSTKTMSESSLQKKQWKTISNVSCFKWSEISAFLAMIRDMYINCVNLEEELKNQNVQSTLDKHDIMSELLRNLFTSIGSEHNKISISVLY